MHSREDGLIQISDTFVQDVFLVLIQLQENMLNSQKDIFNIIDQAEKKFLLIQNKSLSYGQQLNQLYEKRIEIFEKADLLFETVGNLGLQDFNSEHMKCLEGFKTEAWKNKQEEEKLQIEFKAMLQIFIEYNEIETQTHIDFLKNILGNQGKIQIQIQGLTEKNSQFSQAIQNRQSQAGPEMAKKIFLNSLTFFWGDFTSHLSNASQERRLIESGGAIVKSILALIENTRNFRKTLEENIKSGFERSLESLIDMIKKLLEIPKALNTQRQKIRIKANELFEKAEGLNPLQAKRLKWYEDEIDVYEKRNQGSGFMETINCSYDLLGKLNEQNNSLKRQFIDFWRESDDHFGKFFDEIQKAMSERLGQSERSDKASSNVQEADFIAQAPTITVSPRQIGIFSNEPSNSVPQNTSMPAPNLFTTRSNNSNSG